MENKPQTIGESKKKGIAVAAITALVAYHPETYLQFGVCLCVLIIAVYAINRQANLDKGEKHENQVDNTGDVSAGS